MSNLQKHKKTHKTQQPAPEGVFIEQDETENAISALTDGQHFFYVTADQTQLVISTIAPNGNELETEQQNTDFSPVMESGVGIAELEGGEPPLDVELTAEHEGEENMISFVQSEDGQMQQAIEITTEDGRRVTLIIPTNHEDSELSPDYQLET